MSSNSCPIKNIIVVMLENRSYDNILGCLYDPNNQSPYTSAPTGQINLNGLKGTETNPAPNKSGSTIQVANQATPTFDPNSNTHYPATTIPIFDPGEPFNDMAQQIYGLSSVPTSNPYTSYPPPQADAMQGFTLNYALQSKVPAANIPDVMNYFTPAQMPVTSWLANKFAVCDQWFASAPTQTFANRAFAHCAAPGVTTDLFHKTYSLIDDKQYFTDSRHDLPSVFSQLDAVYPDTASDSPPNWKVYFHDYAISVMTVPYVHSTATSSNNVNVATFDNSDWGESSPSPEPYAPYRWVKLGAVPTTFIDDLTSGKLPMYSFIEPRYSYNWAPNQYAINSNHPGGSDYKGNTPGPDNPPTDAANGEVFLMNLYNAIEASDYWKQTLLIITYDEHGGLYDHVTPPSAIPPGNGIPPAGDIDDKASDGFNFNVLGCRVPTIVVSPYIQQGTTIPQTGQTPFDHTSIIKTVWECFDLSTPHVSSLTERDAAAPSLIPFLTSGPANNPGPYSRPSIDLPESE